VRVRNAATSAISIPADYSHDDLMGVLAGLLVETGRSKKAGDGLLITIGIHFIYLVYLVWFIWFICFIVLIYLHF
jgi:hypothetical protein